VVWAGSLASGAGTVSSGSGALELAVTWVTVTGIRTLDEVDGAPRITGVELTVLARASSLDSAGLERGVATAAELCPVSNALRGNVGITVQGEVDEG
jgi:X-X-X-Leu-X-X-Gly heptad repeat protein